MYQNMIAGWSSVPYNSGDGFHIVTHKYNKMSEIWYVKIESLENSISTIISVLHLLLK